MNPVRLPDLTEGDLAWCKIVAGVRTASSRMAGIKRPFKTSYEEQMAQEEMGVKAEYSFCKAYGVFFNMALNGKDVGYDCTLKKQRIDIKSICEKHKNLLVKRGTKPDSCDLYILIYVEGVQCEIYGWEFQAEVLKDEHLKSNNTGPGGYLIDKEDLREWK